MRASSTCRSLGLLVVLAALSACGSGGGGGTSVDPNAPVISNLRVTFGARCSLSNGLPGTIEFVGFDFGDADGDVRGGTVESTATFGFGDPSVLTAPIPAPGVTIDGASAGTISVRACLRFGSNSSYREQVRIIDVSGRSSNTLTATVSKPAGLPLTPLDTDPAPYRSLESR